VKRAASPGKGATGTGAVLLTLGGLTAAFGAASCCALPMLLGGLGAGTLWLGAIAAFAEPHRTLLLAAAAVCLASGAVLFWRQFRSGVCSPGAICARPASRALTLVGLVGGAVLLYLSYVYA
jgi:mercuric ion transport protein